MTDDVHSPALKAREKWLVISPDTEESRAAYRDQRERAANLPRRGGTSGIAGRDGNWRAYGEPDRPVAASHARKQPVGGRW